MLPYFTLTLEWQELGLGLAVQRRSAVPRVFLGFGGDFEAFPGVWKRGWPGYSTFVPQEGTCMCQLPTVGGPLGGALAPQ